MLSSIEEQWAKYITAIYHVAIRWRRTGRAHSTKRWLWIVFSKEKARDERTQMVRKAQQPLPNQQLRLARQQRGWTQQQVADHIGAPLALNVTRWERGTARPSAHYVQRLCELFDKSVS